MSKKHYQQELCSRCVKAGHRIYFVDAKIDREGNRFIAISELRGGKDKSSPRERHRIHIYEEDMPKFIDAISDALTALAEERQTQEIEPIYEPTANAAQELLGIGLPTQVEIPQLDDILTDDGGAS